MKTTAQKKLQGTFQANKERAPLAFDPLTKPPTAPESLTGDALKYWEDVTQLLLEAGTLTKGDLPAILRASQTYGIHQQAVRDVEINGAYQITQGGYSTKNGYYVVMTDAEKALSTFERAFGFTPYSRSKLPPPEPRNDEPDPFDRLMHPEKYTKNGKRKK